MPSFTVDGLTATFRAAQEQSDDKGGVLEELTLKMIVADSTTWGALFSLRTPREQMSIRVAKAQTGESTVVIDLGGGAGVGQLVFEDGELDDHDAIMTDLSSEAPVGIDGPRVAKATFLIIPGA